ncbi:uncharacterized protein BO80DRAFT_449641 [Aspergillus ibericus CBS 121593]|uniref:Aminoglycoside phosphotransferase domain-containing protein n=1 Tax=Aspergillus ibericus CBS 121593 TaxID=1448316 RepID=A0A395GKY4_9EURO|nr:hypothetical protein BO80DRAFT_449641 [Aspergillus ibericus CBS 121593]RAK96044.1 hypothetical protein BO80DRAFT_449641 [Aspergillus ibericus CBS 121593]
MTRREASLPLIRGTTTLESALEQEEDMLLELDYPEQRIDFFVSLYTSRAEIAKVAAGHLGLCASDTCELGAVKEWLHGSFNVCIPIYVSNHNQPLAKRAVIRFPLPYKVGESRHPGNVDETLRCEAATFIWMREQCPEIPIPRLWGFGLDIRLGRGAAALQPAFMSPPASAGTWGNPNHQSNVFVDNDWNITCVIDLEWACSLPAETLQPPYWLTGRSVDGLTDGYLEEFRQAHEEFVNIFEEEESSVPPINDDRSFRANLMRTGWQIGTFWYLQALDSPKGLYHLFEQHIHPIFVSSHKVTSESSQMVSDYWAADAETVITTKLRDKEASS